MGAIAAIAESYINRTEGYRIHDQVTPIKETYFDEDASPGEIYRECLKEHGRCTSKVYIDTKDGPKAIGWVFQKREKYEDVNETFLKETWVTLLSEYDPRPRKSYLYIS
jgi:hypothetical protein